ncbi:centrosomal protein of 128 kDa-like isoform X3 [Carcharodon carcharias]|uniref:centrosomal protein of 128 kDa-like isoform X3 n=1 Tax=Carcharodon carcharias TaxID=13397 RepID=UPI001B7DA064|nr:centrosomal protein of 128 kDa-like isoform X3 [Carcharodon carcharias]
MADSSSDSDTCLHNFSRRRGPLKAKAKRRSRMHNAVDVSEKIDTLTSTLQDTSRDLSSVDRMLGRYRGYTNEQMETVAQLRDDLEQSIDELRSQRLSRHSGRSIPSLHTSDLQGNSATESRRYRPTSPLRDPGGYLGAERRRSRSATVRFVDDLESLNHVHTLHQSLRDLRSDQLRLGEEFDDEIAKRNRTDVVTRKTVDSLSEKLRDMSRTETVSQRVERRLQEIEKEMRTERELAERRQDQLGHMAVQLKEELKKHNGKINEVEEMKSKLAKTEDEKSLIEQELGRTRRRLDQSEGSRETLASQIDDLRSQLLRAEQERATLQHRISQSQQKSYHGVEEDDRQNQAGAGRSDHEKQLLEKQILELRAQLNRNAVLSEAEELKRSLERQQKEKSQLCARIEALSSDLEKREKQQLRMLSQLQEIQNRYDDCMQDRKSAGLEIVDLARQLKESSVETDRCRAQLKEVELLRLESEKRKDELKIKAQESIKQWKIKCKKLERDMEKQKEITDQWTEQYNQASKEKEALQSQQMVALHQMENLRKELNDVILKRVQQEEDMRRKDVELNELKSRLLDLDGKLHDSKESLSKLEDDLRKQCMLHAQTKEEKQHLEDELLTLSRQNEKGQEKLLEMQRAISELSAIRSELITKLAQEEISTKEIRKSILEAQAKQALAQEELTSISSQLKLERDAHQQELVGIRTEMQTLRTEHERNMQEALKQFQQERDKLENNISELKAELTEDKNLTKTQRRQMEKVKTECNKLTEELIQGEAENAKLRRKYHLLKQELEEKGKLAVNGEECARQLEQITFQLKDQIRRVQTEQETILCAVGKEIDAACDFLSRDPGDKFKAITLTPGLENDPHRWLAEMKTKLQWLCEEVKERDGRELKLRCHLRQCRGQLKELLQDKESESQLFIEQITKQEHLLEEIHREKRELLQKMCQKDEEMRTLQDRIADLESSTRVALDHLESVPERLSILDGIRDLEDSQRHREMIEERYSKYKEIVSSLQQQLRDSTRRIQVYRHQMAAAGTEICRPQRETQAEDKSSAELLMEESLLQKRTSIRPQRSSDVVCFSSSFSGWRLPCIKQGGCERLLKHVPIHYTGGSSRHSKCL